MPAKDHKKKKNGTYKYDLAILINSQEVLPPSDKRAIQKFVKASEKLGFSTDLIEPADFARVPIYDALFIRETTSVNHHTYQFARRAEAEGLVVLDDPLSILRCCNKVFLNELLQKNQIASPKTCIVTEENSEDVMHKLQLPCIIKIPDSSFSQGVVKVSTETEFREQVHEFLERSELLIAQEFLPTEFDWRVGVIDGEPLFVCKYYMAPQHWQIIKRSSNAKLTEGRVDTFDVQDVPKRLITTAIQAAKLMGHGLYGVDIKQVGNQFLVIEVNDNPSLEAGMEDAIIGEALYERIMQSFLNRLERLKGYQV